MIPGYLLSAFPHRQFLTLPGLLDSRAALSNLMHCVPCREADCTMFMMVFGITRPRGELTTYRARGGYPDYSTVPVNRISKVKSEFLESHIGRGGG